MSESDHHRFLTVEEAAKELRISRAALYTLMKNKKIRVAKIGGRTYIDRKDLEDFIERSKSIVE
jgi:excisionase family DNA binding protein